jgi:hypothetical protein
MNYMDDDEPYAWKGGDGSIEWGNASGNANEQGEDRAMKARLVEEQHIGVSLKVWDCPADWR